ncbi:YbgA family protein [Wenzhouxiangella sp. EGI_FJ10305]|uniref:hypothetical protein n=1 Tax=Wenzhouxiangella sp. EGI_FJ10305 TaxID=3243768 RepID=UPI0035DAB469
MAEGGASSVPERLELPPYLDSARLVQELDASPVPFGPSLALVRRRQIAAELRLRQYFDDSARCSQGRIRLPDSVQLLWRQHKYSALARDERGYRQTGPDVAQGRIGFEALAAKLNAWLSEPPGPGGLRNAVEHMWGHVSERAERMRADVGDEPLVLLAEVGHEAVRQDNRYLLEQTALTELFGWHDE